MGNRAAVRKNGETPVHRLTPPQFCYLPPGLSVPTALHKAAFRLAIADALLITPSIVILPIAPALLHPLETRNEKEMKKEKKVGASDARGISTAS